MTPIHHIYVDFENVQSIKLGLIAGKPVTVTLVLGRQQTSLPVDLTSKMLEHAGKVRIVQTAISGRDFQYSDADLPSQIKPLPCQSPPNHENHPDHCAPPGYGHGGIR